MDYFVRFINLISKAVNILGQLSLVVMIFVVIGSILLRLLRISSTGAFELIVLLGTITFVAPWAITQFQKRHIEVKVLITRFPEQVQAIVRYITYFLSLGACGIAIKYSLSHAIDIAHSGQVMAATFPVPACIPGYFVFAMFTLLALVILIDLVDYISGRQRNEP